MRRKLLAWSIHLLTASGVVLGFLAILAIFEGEWRAAMILMGIATIIDGFDGSLSRLAQVTRVLPGFDGAMLDNIVDFQCYVVVPALFIYQAGLVPANWLVAAPVLILLASSYQFAQADAKTEDHFFKGFPSYWNVLVIYFVLFATPPLFNLAVLLACAVMVFVPLRYLYPSRMAGNRGMTIFLTVIWVGVMGVILWQYPAVQPWLLWASLLYVVYYLGMSLWANVRPLLLPISQKARTRRYR
jgi:phosphatidylcholine synthase